MGLLNKVEVSSAKKGKKINVYPYLLEPRSFYGDMEVDHLVKFKDSLSSLIGKYHGTWNKNNLFKDGIVILENYYDESKRLMIEINKLASKIVNNPALYDDKSISTEYYHMADAGYKMLIKHQDEFDFNRREMIPLSLERAGLVTTRLALGLGKDGIVKDEVRVVTKRTHLKAESTTNLSVTVLWRDLRVLRKINKKPILMADFVNPASGASTLALVLSARKHKIVPLAIYNRSISSTKKGIFFMKKALMELGIKSYFYSVGVADEMNSTYYLVGDRTVADAGHILRHYLPKN